MTRTQLAKGIWRDDYGIQAIVKGGRGAGNTKRFRPGDYPTASPAQLLARAKRWQLDRLATLQQATTSAPAPVARGSLRGDVPRYLALLPLGPARDNASVLLATWLKTPLATMPRASITRELVQQQLAAWGSSGGRSGKGYAASTLNHRVQALRALYRALDDAPDPTVGLLKLREPEPEPRGVPFALAQSILDAIKDRGGVKVPVLPSKARLRLAVILYTGLPHAQVMRLKREHIDFDGATLLTTPRRKGAGARARRLPLLPEAVAALRAFDAAGCYGEFATTPVRRAWDLAKRAVAEKIEDTSVRAMVLGLRPYDLRHSFLTEVYRHSGDHRATAELGLHAPGSKITHRYTLAAVEETALRAIAAVTARTSSK